jgi:Fe-S cluster assembly scaffold protein SufB
MTEASTLGADLGNYALGWSDEEDYVFKPRRGLDADIVREMSFMKKEPEWMLDFRLKSYNRFERRPLPTWGGELGGIDFDNIFYYIKPTEEQVSDWDDVPESIKNTYERLGIPEAERQHLAGVTAQYESEVVYHRNREDLEAQGVIFSDMGSAVREHPELVRKYFGRVIPPNDNKFSALNSAVWSGGSFIYVPPGVSVELPLQAYFRINAENMGQFERTLIIADEGAQVHYVEGCSAPVYTSDSLHSAVVEIVVGQGARVTYTTIQNWSNNVYNLVTKRARVEAEGHMEWIDGNIGCLAEGSRVTTPGGTKPIQLVTPGDEVLSYDEATGSLCWRRVTAKRYSGEQAVRTVQVGSRRLRVTDNHPFYSYVHDASRPKKLGRYRLAYVRADQLDKAIVPISSLDYGEPHKLSLPETRTVFDSSNQYSDGFVARRERPERLDVDETTTDELMWLFGLFTGDGSIESSPAQSGGRRWAKVVFSVPRQDRARARLTDVMGRVMPGAVPSERADGVTVAWNSVDLAALLEDNGFESGALRKRVPGWVLDLPESQRLSYVAGYLDSDGCAPAGRRGLSIKSANRSLLEDVGDVLTSLGISSRIHTEFDGERPVRILGYDSVARGSHRLEFPADPRLLAVVSPELLEAVARQREPANRHFRLVGRSSIELPAGVEIRDVTAGTDAEVVPTWDIEVEGTGNFVSEGFIVHNSQLTMKYPAVVMVGPKASGEVLSVAYAGVGQHQDTGAKMTHAAPETTSKIVSKSISKDGGRTSYRGLVRVEPDATGCKSHVQCDALILDPDSVSDTYPYMEVGSQDAVIGHEATVSKVADEQLFYLMSRGLSEEQAMGMIVNGFVEPVTRTLPMEYAVEWSRLIELQMEGSVG